MKKRLLLFIPFLLLLNSCGETVPDNTSKELLIGSWIFESGTRDGGTEGTELLNSLTFTFTNDQFECELLPEMMPSLDKEESYELKENRIVVDEQFELEIKDLSPDNLSLKFELILNGSPTVFDLKFKPQKTIK
jgi:hypothetical protein